MRRLAGLELVARRAVEGTFTGLHRSTARGLSTDFLEHRPYVQGDDLRRLDWKVFGKTDRPYVRQFEDDTHLRATLLVDASGSMAFGSGAETKLDHAARLAAALACLLLRQNDAVGLVLFDHAPRLSIAPRHGTRQLQRLFHALEEADAGGETSLAQALQAAGPRLPRHGLAILITDALDDPEALIHALARLRRSGQELILIQTLDRRELDFRFWGPLRFEPLEGAPRRLDLDGAQTRRAYLARLERFLETLRRGCAQESIDHVLAPTDTPFEEALAAYLRRRGEHPWSS